MYSGREDLCNGLKARSLIVGFLNIDIAVVSILRLSYLLIQRPLPPLMSMAIFALVVGVVV